MEPLKTFWLLIPLKILKTQETAKETTLTIPLSNFVLTLSVMNVWILMFVDGVEKVVNVWPVTLEMPYALETALTTGSSMTKPTALD